jgi:hypothetical protein
MARYVRAWGRAGDIGFAKDLEPLTNSEDNHATRFVVTVPADVEEPSF